MRKQQPVLLNGRRNEACRTPTCQAARPVLYTPDLTDIPDNPRGYDRSLWGNEETESWGGQVACQRSPRLDLSLANGVKRSMALLGKG